jgi:hypothetical protein
MTDVEHVNFLVEKKVREASEMCRFFLSPNHALSKLLIFTILWELLNNLVHKTT